MIVLVLVLVLVLGGTRADIEMLGCFSDCQKCVGGL